jgi:tetratricopeptide (TPR) repeat protein
LHRLSFFKKREGFLILFWAILLLRPSLFLWAQEGNVRILDENLQMDLANHFFNTGDYYRAITEYKRFLFFFPHSLKTEEVYFQMAKSYLKGKKWEEALLTLDRWQKQFPHSSRQGEAYLLKGLSYLGKKEYTQAHYFFQQASLASPGTPIADEAHYQAGRAYIEEEKYKEAALAFRKIDRASPLFGRGEYLAQGLEKIDEVPQKSPGAAGVLAAILPGAGHWYCERYRDATIAFLLNAAFIWGMVEAFQHENYAVGAILTFFELGWYSGNIYSAISSAHKYNKQKKKEYLQDLEKGSYWRGGVYRDGRISFLVLGFSF